MKKVRHSLLIFFILLLVSLGIPLLLHYSVPERENHTEDEFHIILTELIHDDIEARIHGPIMVAKAMAKNGVLLEIIEDENQYSEEYMAEKMRIWLSGIQSSGDYSSAFFVSEKTHRYYTPQGIEKVIQPYSDNHDGWYTNFITKNVEMVLDVDIDQMNDNRWTVFLNVRVENQRGKLLGVCGVGIIMSDLQKLFVQYEKRYKIKINLVNKDGLVQVDTHTINIETTYHSGQLLSQSEEYVFIHRKNGFIVTSYISDLDWYLVVQNSVPEYRTAFFNGAFGAGVFLAFVIIFLSAYFLLWKGEKNQNSHVSQVSVTDPLTGLYNRNYFKEIYGERGIFNTTRYKSIAVFDIDFFKEANDRLDGDAVLKYVTSCAKSIFGEQDELFRWGGVEFTVLMVQPLQDAYDLCRRFVTEVENNRQVTVSVGVTEVRLSDTIKKNYYRAAQGCYLVKEMGGNGVKRS